MAYFHHCSAKTAVLLCRLLQNSVWSYQSAHGKYFMSSMEITNFKLTSKAMKHFTIVPHINFQASRPVTLCSSTVNQPCPFYLYISVLVCVSLCIAFTLLYCVKPYCFLAQKETKKQTFPISRQRIKHSSYSPRISPSPIFPKANLSLSQLFLNLF